MAKKISQLGLAGDVTVNDLFQVVDKEDTTMAASGTNKRITAATLGNFLPVTATGSSASRSLKDRFADIVNVKDFGAVGDGVTDDTAAIQAALNTGKNVFINPTSSYYLITAELTMLDYQRISGGGKLSQLRQTTPNLNVISASNKVGCVVENINAHAVGTRTNLASGNGIAFFNSTRCEALGNLVQNHRGGGVALYNANDCLVSGNTFINSPVSNLDLNSQTSGDILVIYSSSRNRIIANHCKSGNGIGVYVQSIEGTNACDDNVISGNVVQDCKAYGIMVYRNEDSATATQSVRRNVIIGNVIKNISGTILNEAVNNYSFGAGIYVQGAEGTDVIGNTIDNTHSGAVTFTETLAPGAIGVTNVSSALVSGNIITNAKMFGIDVGDPLNIGASTGFVVISNNTITTTSKSGVNVRNGKRVKISGNIIDASTVYGIRANNTSDKSLCFVTDNIVRSTGNSGISFNYVTTGQVCGNTIDDSTVHGITMSNTSDVQVNDNIVTGYASRGIEVGSTCIRTEVFDNHIRGDGSGVSAEGLTLNAITTFGRNRVENCTTLYAGSFGPYRTLAVNNTTPSVSEGNTFITANTAPTTITNFTSGVHGQEVVVIIRDSNTTLDFSSSNLRGNAGVDMVMATNDAIRAVYNSTLNTWWVSIIKGS